MSGKNKLLLSVALFGFLGFSGLSCGFFQTAQAAKKKESYPLGISNGECVSAKYAIGPADQDLKSMQNDFGCNMALIEDYGKGISLSQFGYMGEEAPSAGFVTKIDPKKSSPSRSYASVTDLIVKQRRIPAEAGWCIAEIKMPDQPKNDPKSVLKIPQWLISCIAWGTSSASAGSQKGAAEKILAIVNFKGSVPLPLPDAPRPTESNP